MTSAQLTVPATSIAPVAIPPSAKLTGLAIAALEAGIAPSDVRAYVEHQAVAASALRAIWNATHPDFREHAADLRNCRVGVHRSRLGDLTAFEAEVLLAVLTKPRWSVTYYSAPGTRTVLFVSMTEASDFARNKTLRGRPASVLPVTEAA
jgi:hypothetical protein